MKKFFEEFKAFALKGNMMDMAIGVIIGGAFSTLVTSLTDNLISPILGILGKVNFDAMMWDVFGDGKLVFKYGAFITAVINFLIMAFVLFLIVKGMNKLMDMGKKEEAPAEPEAPAAPTQEELLASILEELKKQKDKADFSEKVAAMRQGYNRRIEELRDTADPVKERKTEEYHLPRALREGETVTVAAINRQGTVISGPDKNGAYQIQLGNMKMKCEPGELRLPEDAPKPPKKKQTPTGGTRTSRPGNTEREARSELDIRGMASDEGLMEVDRFLDRCMMMGIKNATIIHGKGTGVLRAAVQQHLRRLSFVKSQRPGMYGEGEMGVTVVELK